MLLNEEAKKANMTAILGLGASPGNSTYGDDFDDFDIFKSREFQTGVNAANGARHRTNCFGNKWRKN